jgi:hypothetical protein
MLETDLKAALQNITTRWGYKLNELPNNVFSIDVKIPIKDKEPRYQFVFVWIVKGRFFGKDVVYLSSRCGTYHSGLNLYNLLRESGYCNLSAVTITNDTDKEGRPCETVVVHSGQPLEFVSEAMLDNVIYEVAYNADIVEERYFGGDKN